MNKKKIVFILNNVTITRCLKRVGEFIDNGYDVDVYGFEKLGEESVRIASDIEKLHGIDLPSGHRNVVRTVGFRVARRLPVRVYAKDMLHETAVGKVAKHQTGQRYAECYHTLSFSFCQIHRKGSEKA